jgi:hypothetical protein
MKIPADTAKNDRPHGAPFAIVAGGPDGDRSHDDVDAWVEGEAALASRASSSFGERPGRRTERAIRSGASRLNLVHPLDVDPRVFVMAFNGRPVRRVEDAVHSVLRGVEQDVVVRDAELVLRRGL